MWAHRLSRLPASSTSLVPHLLQPDSRSSLPSQPSGLTVPAQLETPPVVPPLAPSSPDPVRAREAGNRRFLIRPIPGPSWTSCVRRRVDCRTMGLAGECSTRLWVSWLEWWVVCVQEHAYAIFHVFNYCSSCCVGVDRACNIPCLFLSNSIVPMKAYMLHVVEAL